MTIEQTIKKTKAALVKYGRCLGAYEDVEGRMCLLGAKNFVENGKHGACYYTDTEAFLNNLAPNEDACGLNDSTDSDEEVFAFLDEAASVARTMGV